MSPVSASKPCKIPRCSGFAEKKGYCEKHYELYGKNQEREASRYYDKHGRNLEKKEAYNQKQHKKLRKRMMSLFPLCQAEGCNQPSTELDHIDGDVWNLKDESWGSECNLQMLCKGCHSIKTNREKKKGND